MFEDLPKNAEDLLYCKNVTEYDNNKIYTFEKNINVDLDKKYKICSRITNNKLLIEKDGLFGVVVLISDSLRTIIEPKYNKVDYGKDYLIAQDETKFYVFNYLGKKIYEDLKTKDFELLGSDIFNNGKLFEVNRDGVDYTDASWFENKVGGYRFILIQNDKTKIVGDDYIEEPNSDYVIRYSEDYKEKNKVFLDFPWSEVSINKNDPDIILVESKYEYRKISSGHKVFINIKNSKKSNWYDDVTEFVDGIAYAELPISRRDDKKSDVVKINKEFNEIEPKLNIFSSFTICNNCLRFHSNTSRGLGAGFCDWNENIVMKPNAKYYWYSNNGLTKVLDKALLKRFKKQLRNKSKLPDDYKIEDYYLEVEKHNKNMHRLIYKLGCYLMKKGREISDFYGEENIPDFLKLEDNKKDEVDLLEEKLENYIKIMNLPKLELKLRLLQKKSKDEIYEDSDEEIDKRKELVFGSGHINLTTDGFYKKSLDKYKQELKNFIKIIEDNYYIVEILKTLNNISNCLNGKKNEEDDSVVCDAVKLYNLYFNLNDDDKEKNIKLLKKLIKDEIEKVSDYVFKKNGNWKYSSYNDWELDFRRSMYVLVQTFKEDYEFKQISDNIELMKYTKETINDNKFKSVVTFYKEIQDTIERIESKTEDKVLLNDIEEFKNFKIDSKKSHSENIKQINEKLMKILEYEANIDWVLDPNKTKILSN